jgi:hypothetical protein
VLNFNRTKPNGPKQPLSLLRPAAAATADDVDFGPCPSAAIACVILGRPQVHTISIETDMLVLIEAADTNWEVV